MLKYKYLLVTISAFTLIFVSYLLTRPHSIGGFVDGDFQIINKLSSGIVISHNKTNVFLKTKEAFNTYDWIHVKGSVSKIVNTSEFDSVTYMKSNNIFNEIKSPILNLISKTNDIRNKFSDYLNDSPESYKIVTPLLLVGEKTLLSKDIYNMSLQMNVVHLFVISGFHISLFCSLLSKLMKLCRIPNEISYILPLLIVWVYLFFLGFPISALRAGIYSTLVVLNNLVLKDKFSKVQILSVVMIIILVYKPMSLFSLSFIFTFIASYVIVFINMIKFEKKYKKALFVLVFAYLSNILITLYTNKAFSVFGIVYSTVLTPIFAFMYISTMLLFPIKPLLDLLDKCFIWMLKSLNEINLIIKISSFNINIIYGVYGMLWSSFIMFNIWNYYLEKKAT